MTAEKFFKGPIRWAPLEDLKFSTSMYFKLDLILDILRVLFSFS